MYIGENKNKIANIVMPQMDLFVDLYSTLILNDMNLHWNKSRTSDTLVKQDVTPTAIFKRLLTLPKYVIYNIMESATFKTRQYQDTEEVIRKLCVSSQRTEKIEHAVRTIVKRSSWTQSAKGLLTAGFLRSSRYALAKLKKMIRWFAQLPVVHFSFLSKTQPKCSSFCFQMKIAVVGLGGTGSAAVRFLAGAGHQAVGYEQFQIGHVNGSSHGESRIIRYTYPDLLFTQMMSDAYRLWFELEKEAQEELFVRCGGLYFGDPDDADIIDTEQALIDAHLPYERLTAEQTREKHPAFRLNSNQIALYQKDSGFLRATRCVLANIRLAKQYGATIHENVKVQEVYTRADRSVVRSSLGEEEFDRVIVTAGPWMSTLFRQLNLPLKMTRQQILYLNIREHEEYFQSNGPFPVWIDATDNLYGFPSDGQIAGVKLAFHHCGSIISDLDAERAPVDESYKEEIRQYAKKRFPNLGSDITYSETCIYTNTPNADFIIDRLPDQPNLFLVSGCSGHGFKFTVLLGKIISMIATDDHGYDRDLSRFKLSQFL